MTAGIWPGNQMADAPGEAEDGTHRPPRVRRKEPVTNRPPPPEPPAPERLHPPCGRAPCSRAPPLPAQRCRTRFPPQPPHTAAPSPRTERLGRGQSRARRCFPPRPSTRRQLGRRRFRTRSATGAARGRPLTAALPSPGVEILEQAAQVHRGPTLRPRRALPGAHGAATGAWPGLAAAPPSPEPGSPHRPTHAPCPGPAAIPCQASRASSAHALSQDCGSASRWAGSGSRQIRFLSRSFVNLISYLPCASGCAPGLLTVRL